MIDESRLDGIALFEPVSARARRELAARSVLLSCEAGESFWQAGEPPRGILVVLSGSVRLLRALPNGRSQVIHREGPGSVLGEIPLLDGEGYPATAEAETDCRAILVTPEAFHAALAADPAFAALLLRNLASRVRGLVDRIEGLTALTVRGRLARALLERADEAGGDSFELGMTQTALADELGTVREVVVRHLSELRDRGILATPGRARYRIVDRQALELLAG